MKRARAPEQKAARRDALLAAAAHCFMTNGHRLPSAAEVAQAAGVAKGTVYLYFKTKESIFLALLGHKFHTLLERVTALDGGNDLAGQLSDRLIAFVEAEPSFLPLSALLQSVLEQNLDVETLMAFKRDLAQALVMAGDALERTFNLPTGMGNRALLHSHASMVGIWQLVQWPKALEGERSNPDFLPLRRDFDEELRWALERIWRLD